MQPHDLSAHGLLAAYRAKTLSPVEAVDDILAHIARWEPRLMATYAFDPDAARKAAKVSSERWAKGEPMGALDGVPITIKENIATEGVPVPLGTAATALVPASADAPPAARVREAGAIILGKTTMPDYGMLSSGLSSFHPLTKNPWDLTKNPGGSSAGASAAAAAGYGPLHIGTDIGGSVRLPAGWTGIFALKPSNGRVPIDPPYYGRVAGPMTRSVNDAALLMSILAQPDRRDHMSLPPVEIDWLGLERSVKGLRIGFLSHAGFGLAVDPEVLAAVGSAARLFEQAGAVVEPLDPFLDAGMIAGLDVFWRTRAWADMARLSDEQRAHILPFIRTWAEKGREASGQAVFEGMQQMIVMRAAVSAALTPYDFLLSPTSSVPAYAAELPCPTNDPEKPFEHIAFTVAFNMSEHPAATINCGYTASGLPIGLQIVGQRFDDLGVLRMSFAFEQMRGAQRPWPTP